ncbi:MAG: YidC/Oxa1 family membrane protein insertase [Patescibacteria group bacterium]
MISSLFHTVFYNPLYNGLIFLIDLIPGGNIGVAVIIFTIVVKLILMPLSKGAVVTQLKMKQLEPELTKLREKYKDNPQEQGKKMLEFYRANGLNPFAGILLMLIQLPIILALAFIFYRGGLPVVNTELLYSFVQVPATVGTHFLGLIDVSVRNVFLGALAGITQFFQVQFSVPAYKATEGKEPNFKDDLARSMNVQMRYVLPALVFFISLGVSGAVALYWITSNLFTIAQELYFRKTIKKNEVVKV